MFTSAEIIEAIPVIISLVVIEGLLSVDNALAIAALASHLPKEKQQLALKLGIIGAYAFRGVALVFVSLIVANPWLKLAGAVYLIHLMASNLARRGEETPGDGLEVKPALPGLWATVAQIELMDLSLSLDNVVAAVALDKRLWVICTGVFIGILALRFLAAYCIRLIEKFPILGKTAYLLIGFVGVILIVEVGCEMAHVEIHVSSIQKFSGIVAIVALSLLYDRHALTRAILTPVVRIGKPIMIALDKVIGAIFWPVTKIISAGRNRFTRKPASPLPGN